jgi:hypothetical protein
MSKLYTAKKTINGIEYTAQFNGISAAYEAVDNSYLDDGVNIGVENLAQHLLTHTLIEPKRTFADFGADKIGKKETREINGKKYTAEFKGVLTALRAVDTCYIDGTSNTSVEKINKYILENVIVEPKNLELDDFESTKELNEVVKFGREAMNGWGAMKEYNEVISFLREVSYGNFRNSTDKGTTKKESKE